MEGTTTEARARRWKWIRHDGGKLWDVGVNGDGTLHNPNGYPEATVRAAVEAAIERRRRRAQDAAKRGADTRKARHDRRVYDVARRIVAGEKWGPREHCAICGRGLNDPGSIERGIGSECWQWVLGAITESRAKRAEHPQH